MAKEKIGGCKKRRKSSPSDRARQLRGLKRNYSRKNERSQNLQKETGTMFNLRVLGNIHIPI